MKLPIRLLAAFILFFIARAVWAQSLGTTNLLEGPAAGSDSVVLAASGSWTATTNATWLHLSVANQSGTGSTNVVFTFDANTGTTHTGTLTIAGQTLNVTQAGSTYVAAGFVKLVSGLSEPNSVAVDGAGNVYIANENGNNIQEWIAASNIVKTLVSTGLRNPYGVAVDGSGNVYIADTDNYAIKEWVAASNTVITLVSSGLSLATGVAVDGSGNVFIANSSSVLKWTAANNTVSTLFSSVNANAVAVDGSGNVYIVGFIDNTMKEWTAASSTVKTLATFAFGNYLYNPTGVAVDGSGNVYAAAGSYISEWIAASNTVTLFQYLSFARGLAFDGAGNLYVSNPGNNTIDELLSHTFVDATAKVEPALAGVDSLSVVLPATANLTGPFTPASDSPWLTITGVTNGVVSFAFATDYSTNRTAHISLLGQSIAVTQPAIVPPLLTSFTILDSGAFQFGFTNNQSVAFTVWTTTNLALPFSNWTVLGTLTNDGSGQYLFTDPNATNYVQQFYRVTSP